MSNPVMNPAMLDTYRFHRKNALDLVKAIRDTVHDNDVKAAVHIERMNPAAIANLAVALSSALENFNAEIAGPNPALIVEPPAKETKEQASEPAAS